MAVFTSESEFSPSYQISVCLYRNVQNSSELKQMLMSGEVSASFIKPSLVTSVFPLQAAANKALLNHIRNKKVTRSLHAELLFCLSPSKNISDAFKKFGMGDKDSDSIVVEIAKKENSCMDKITEAIQGEATSLDELSQLTDTALVKKVYKVTDAELSCGNLDEAVVCRIATKDFVSF